MADRQPPNSGASAPTENSFPPELSVRERMRLIRAQGRAVVKPLASETVAVTPQTAEDTAVSAAPPEPDPPLGTIPPATPQHQPSHGLAPVTSIETPPTNGPLGNDDVDPAPTIAPQDIHINPADPSSIEPPRLSKVPKPPVPEQDLISNQIVSHLSQDASLEEDAESFGLRLGVNEFAVALSMDYRVHDAYEAILAKQSASIEDFLENIPTSEEDPRNSNMLNIIKQLDNACVHADLNMSTSSVAEPPQQSQNASWAEYQSSKFKFLGHLIDGLSDSDMNIVIMGKPGKLHAILKSFFLGKGFVADGSPEQAALFSRESLSFEIHSTRDPVIPPPVRPVSAIISIDATYSSSIPAINNFRKLATPEGLLIPVIYLIIEHSSEHIERSLPNEQLSIPSLCFLLDHIRELSGLCGGPPSRTRDIGDCAGLVAVFLKLDSLTKSWPLPMMKAIDTQELETPVEPLNASTKRPLSEGVSHLSEIIHASKRQRRSRARSEPADAGTPEKANGVHPDLSIDKTYLDGWQIHLAKLQHRHEALHKRYHQTRQALEKTEADRKHDIERVERYRKENDEWRQERTRLHRELAEARSLSKSEGGAIAQLAEAKEKLAALESSNANLEHSKEQQNSQNSYLVQQYQNASTAAAQSATENKMMAERIKQLEERACGQTVHLKELRNLVAEKAHLAKIDQLEADLAQRQAVLMAKEEELRQLKTRPTTRSNSHTPRSPRNAGSRPGSPLLNNGGTGNTGSKPASALRYTVGP